MVDREQIEWAVKTHDDPVVTAPEVVEALDGETNRNTVRQELLALEAAERVGRKKVGARAVAWWHVDRVRPAQTDPAEHPDQTGLDSLETREPRETAEREPWADVALPDLPGAGPKETDRQEALREALRLIYEAGPSGRSSFYEETWRECATHYASATSWRSNAAGPALAELEERGVVECVDPSAGEWRWSQASE